MIIRLGWPDRKLSPNNKNGKFWGVHQGAKEAAREEGFYAAKKALDTWKDREGNIPLSIVFMPPDKRRRDLDGMLSSMKHHLDGIAKAMNIDDVLFRPVLIDVGPVCKGGSVVIGIGVTIQTGVNL
jgi:crossover junction endodeoxyribonuclease RusA